MTSKELSPQRLESPDSPTGVFEKAPVICKPIQHPQLTKVMVELNPPSPVKLAKDLDQPQFGQIQRKTKRPAEDTDFSLQNIIKPVQREVSLSLETNSLMRKRANRRSVMN